MNADDRRTRLIAFVIITLVFVASVGVLLYWAINLAAACTSLNATAYFNAIWRF